MLEYPWLSILPQKTGEVSQKHVFRAPSIKHFFLSFHSQEFHREVNFLLIRYSKHFRVPSTNTTKHMHGKVCHLLTHSL